jgi:hypothetical protein
MDKPKDNDKLPVTIIVNTREKTWNEKKITYEEVISLAFGSYEDNPNIVYTVTFAKGEESKREGTLVKGKDVRLKDGMIFNVTRTDKS